MKRGGCVYHANSAGSGPIEHDADTPCFLCGGRESGGSKERESRDSTLQALSPDAANPAYRAGGRSTTCCGGMCYQTVRALEERNDLLAQHLKGCASQRDALETELAAVRLYGDADIVAYKWQARAEKAEAEKKEAEDANAYNFRTMKRITKERDKAEARVAELGIRLASANAAIETMLREKDEGPDERTEDC